MVEMRKSGVTRPDSELASKSRDDLPVKLEIAEDDLEEAHGPLNKRYKLWSSGTSSSSMAPAKYNPLDEPSPLGLSLRKSPSLSDLIQMRLTQKAVDAVGSGVKKESKCITAAASAGATLAPGSIEKLKASNFAATVLKIGKWEVSPVNFGISCCFIVLSRSDFTWFCFLYCLRVGRSFDNVPSCFLHETMLITLLYSVFARYALRGISTVDVLESGFT